MEVWTDGSITPGDALSYAAKILKGTLSIFVPDEDSFMPAGALAGEADGDRIRDVLNRPIEHLKLSVRSANCLKSAKIRTVGDLVRRRDEELLNVQNFGEKSLDEVREKLQELGLTLGMTDVSRAGG
ncbi:MAG: DNA-directed RNA polymerase subunit alpha C-terminal domain-containing protein, partial [bacterium]